MDDALAALGHSRVGEKTLINLVTRPPAPDKGDFSLPVFRFTPPNSNPGALAQAIVTHLQPDDTFVRFIAMGPYVNAYLAPGRLAQEALAKAAFSPSPPASDAPRVMVEYASPNTNKPLHVGHLRNIALAQSIIALFERAGKKVVKTQVVNDRGVHICKSMLAYQKWGNGKTPEFEKMKPDHFVGKYYTLFSIRANEDPKLEEEAQAMLQQWEQENPSVRALWKRMNEWVEAGWNHTYSILGASFDITYYESVFFAAGKEMVMQAYDKGLLKKADNGAIIVPLETYQLPDKPIVRGDGTTLYFTQDIALAIRRMHEYPDLEKIIHIVGNEQEMHFKQLFATLDLMGVAPSHKFHHLGYGLLRLPTGKMSSREGTVVNADDLLQELETLAHSEYDSRHPDLSPDEINRRSRIIALSAMRFFMIKQDARKEIVFDPKESLSFDGQTGPYLLYANARAQSVLHKSTRQPNPTQGGLLILPREIELLTLLAQKEDMIADAFAHYSPHILAHYLLSLANTFNTYYHETKVIQENEEMEQARLALVKGIHEVLEEGLRLLGIGTLEEM